MAVKEFVLKPYVYCNGQQSNASNYLSKYLVSIVELKVSSLELGHQTAVTLRGNK